MYKAYLLFSLFMITSVVSAQNMQKHLWQDRVILIMASSATDAQLQQQVNILLENDKELTERKLVVYTVTPNGYTQQFPNQESISTTDVCIASNTKKLPFKVALIGLDGGTKLESSNVITASSLFETIDQMPIRRRELTKGK